MNLWHLPAWLIFIYFAHDAPSPFVGAIVFGIMMGTINVWDEYQEKKQREEK